MPRLDFALIVMMVGLWGISAGMWLAGKAELEPARTAAFIGFVVIGMLVAGRSILRRRNAHG